jgi:inosine-uridine nucleoside N-ribohydrolase
MKTENILQKIIIDTDAGHDDVLALMLLAKSERLNILGITTVAGNSTIENDTRNTAFTLDLLQKRNIQIFSGKHKPLKRKLITAVVHGKSGLDGIDTSNTKYKLTDNAHKKISELVRSNPHQVTILTLGPLTNIARAFIADPELPALIKSLVIMGGAINVCGNKNRVAEFNMYVDPEAADIVFRSKVKKVLIPLDPCNEIILTNSDFKKLKKSDLYIPIRNMMRQFIKGIEKHEGVKGALVYDAIAAYYLINPFSFRCKPMDIVIETKGEHTSGMTVVEIRKKEMKNHNINVVTKLNKRLFLNDFIRILNSESLIKTKAHRGIIHI